MKTDKSVEERFWEKVEISDVNFYNDEPCWEWIGGLRRGYGGFNICGKSICSHRFSWILKNGEIENDLQVLHHCDNRICVNPNHLFLGTQLENVKDMFSKNRQNKPKGILHGRHTHPEMFPRGENVKSCKLSDLQVLEIREKYLSGQYFQRQLAEMFDVSQMQISNIINKRQRI